MSRLFAAVLLVACGTLAQAEILPSFSLAEAAKSAESIVVVEEGQIVEVWLGDKKVGDVFAFSTKPAKINVFHGFAGQTDAEIDRNLASKGLKRVDAVSGKRMMHFIPPLGAREGSPAWLMAQDHAYRTVWSEQGQVYAIQQIINPGPSRLVSLDMTEAAFKQAVLDIRAIDAKIEAVSAKLDPAAQAARLLTLLQPGATLANAEVERAVRELGGGAWPAIEAALFQDEYLPHHRPLVYLGADANRRGMLAAAPKIIAAEKAYFGQLDAAGQPYDRQAAPHRYHAERLSAAQWVIDSK